MFLFESVLSRPVLLSVDLFFLFVFLDYFLFFIFSRILALSVEFGLISIEVKRDCKFHTNKDKLLPSGDLNMLSASALA